ncbi:hypothetical protein [Corynebacterium aquilae]|uniref:DUF8175 domain-containing protein n=1 Tax=Corynebacterium aquilae DSM 44791 TaxID=1431546 RepID=A0A1L7CEG0_9CORY|nr:hypothetical protein [Corynebacterium aquilae]APT84229.1 hypothetical protein CAQU_03140 [Corynebacterium aquilae DSM 44791]
MSENDTATANSGRKNLLLVIAAILLALVLVVGLGIKLFGGHDDDTTAAPATTRPDTAIKTSYVKPGKGEKILRELTLDYPNGFDPHQRHFDRQFFDDSQYEIGKYGTDINGDPILMPVGENGEAFGEFKPTDKLDCTVPDEIDVQQQYVHGRVLGVSDQGPTNFEGFVPTGYAKTAVGAVIAASNAGTMAAPYYDPIALEYYKGYIRSKEADKRVELGVRTPVPHGGILPTYAGFKIENCGGDIVTVVGAMKAINPNTREYYYGLIRTPMRWEDGMWLVVVNDQDAKLADQGTVDNLSGFTLVNKV